VNPFRVPFTPEALTDSGGNWLSAAPSSAGAGNVFTVTVDTSSLAPGTYTGVVTVSSPVATSTKLPVNLTIWSGSTPPLTVTPSTVTLTGNADGIPAQSFTVSSGGLPLAVNLKSDIPANSCQLFAAVDQTGGSFQPITPGKVNVSCSGDPGDYSGTVTVTAGTNSVVVPITVHIGPGQYHGLTTPPVIASVVNAASSAPAALAPGEIVAIHGSGVGTPDPMGIDFDATGNIARTLNGLRVLFDGMPAPIVYSSVFQTNVIVPYEIGGRQTTSVQVDSGGSLSDAISLPVAVSAPALFTINSSGLGAASVRNQDNSANDPSNPADRGSTIQIYATGEGQTLPAGITGSVTHKETRKPALPVNVTIGGVEAQVLYAGSAPEAISGLLQVNAVVPQAAQPGAAVSITLKIGASQTQTGATIAIR
jgi:uncharacterized protein (TIGR03437 family)